MLRANRERVLRVVLAVVGLFSLFAVYPLFHLWPTGWRWEPHNPAYEHMIVAVYAVLGVFLLRAVREPQRHRSLILFTGWSNLTHAAVMGMDAVRSAGERAHLVGDVPVVTLAGLLVIWLAPRAEVPGGEDPAGGNARD